MALEELIEPRRSLLVTSPRLLERAPALLPRVNVVETEVVASTERRDIDAIVASAGIEAVVGLGSGRVMDIARLRGDRLGVDVVCVPTLLSTDAFLTATTALREDGVVRYVDGAVARRVVLDEALLGSAPAALNALGACDVLSMSTALRDWHLASRRAEPEPYDPLIAAAGRRICATLLDGAVAIAAAGSGGLRLLLGCLLAEVTLCNLAGTSRPEEGSEHFFAYCLEQRLPGLMHGTMVGLGILICAQLQGRPIARLRRFMAATGIDAAWGGLPRAALRETIVEAPWFVRCQGLPYSIWNEAAPSAADADRLLDAVLLTEAGRGG